MIGNCPQHSLYCQLSKLHLPGQFIDVNFEVRFGVFEPHADLVNPVEYSGERTHDQHSIHVCEGAVSQQRVG